MKSDSVCCECESPNLVPKYVKKSEVADFRAGKPVTFIPKLRPGAERLIVCDDCKAVQPTS